MGMVARVREAIACPYCGERQSGRSTLLPHLLDAHPWDSVQARDVHSAYLKDPLEVYFREASRRKLLSRDAEVALAEEIQRGGPRAEEAKRFLVESNLRLVASVVRQRKFKGADALDLIQDANIGVMRAAELFDPKMGFRFSTYAYWWINQTIQRGMGNLRTIALPANVWQKTSKALRLIDQGERSEDVAREIGLSERGAEKLVAARTATFKSLEAQRHRHGRNGTESKLSDFIAAAPEPEPALTTEELAMRLGILRPKLRHVITRRFGLDGRGETTMDVIGKELGLSRERIRQLEMEALRILRRGRFRKPKVKEANMASEFGACGKGCGKTYFASGAGKAAHERNCDGTAKPEEKEKTRPTPRKKGGKAKSAKPSGVLGETFEMLVQKREERAATILAGDKEIQGLDAAISAIGALR